MKSDIEISKWVRSNVEDSELMEVVSGKLSDRGRPNGSTREDVVISVLANEGCGSIQSAFVNVNIYVTDIWNDITKTWESDTIRLSKLCEAAKCLFGLHSNGFRVSYTDSSQRVLSTGVTFEDGHTEHFINNKLFIKISND